MASISPHPSPPFFCWESTCGQRNVNMLELCSLWLSGSYPRTGMYKWGILDNGFSLCAKLAWLESELLLLGRASWRDSSGIWVAFAALYPLPTNSHSVLNTIILWLREGSIAWVSKKGRVKWLWHSFGTSLQFRAFLRQWRSPALHCQCT